MKNPVSGNTNKPSLKKAFSRVFSLGIFSTASDALGLYNPDPPAKE